MKKLLLLAIVVLGISAVSFGQDGNVLTAQTSASAKIITVLNIQVKSGTLSFGTMTKPQANVTVNLTPAKVRTVTVGGADKISLLNINPKLDVPTYEVTGEPKANFSITLPTSISLGTGVTVNNFVSSTGATTGVQLADVTGKKEFTIGADLVLTTAAVAQEYTSNFNVTVAYE